MLFIHFVKTTMGGRSVKRYLSACLIFDVFKADFRKKKELTSDVGLKMFLSCGAHCLLSSSKQSSAQMELI